MKHLTDISTKLNILRITKLQKYDNCAILEALYKSFYLNQI